MSLTTSASSIRPWFVVAASLLLVRCHGSNPTELPSSGAFGGAGGIGEPASTGGLASGGGESFAGQGGISTGGGEPSPGGAPSEAGSQNSGASSSGGVPAATAGAAGSAGGANAPGGANAGGVGGTSASGGELGHAGEPVIAEFMLGVDISSVQEAAERGTRYADTDGAQKPILEILKAHGFNYVRLRAFVDPSAPYGYAQGTGGTCAKDEPYCDTAHTIEFAKEIKAAGMGFLLDLHYSDTWADPGKQIIPAAWRDVDSISELATRVSTYTAEVLNALVAAGARPDMVQVGNEITPGLLVHVPGPTTDCYGNGAVEHALGGSSSDANWDHLATLLKAGIAAVRAVDPAILVMLHLENTDDLAGARWWLQAATSRDVHFDVLGLSCYTAFQGAPSVWRATFSALASDYPDLKFTIAEYNPEPAEAAAIMRGLPQRRGLGTFLWEPTLSGAWGEALFTSSGNVQRANADDFAVFDALQTELGLNQRMP